MLLTVLLADTTPPEPVQWALWQIVMASAAALVTLSGAAGVVWWLIKPRVTDWATALLKQVQETHHSVTVNGGKSPEPTLRDDISNLRGQVSQLITQGAALAQGNSDIRDQVHDLRTLTEDTRQDLADHVERGEQYVGTVRLVLKSQGIELPPARE